MHDSARERVTLEQYEELEFTSKERLEFRDGRVVALATPSGNHERIAINLTLLLGPQARRRGCDVFAGGAKVIGPNDDRLIPDFVVTCDERDRRAADFRGECRIAHPWLIVEIMSPSSAADDATDKLDRYQSIPSVTHYVLVDSRRRALRLYERTDGGAFVTRGIEEPVELAPLGVTLTLDDVYASTTVPEIVSFLFVEPGEPPEKEEAPA